MSLPKRRTEAEVLSRLRLSAVALSLDPAKMPDEGYALRALTITQMSDSASINKSQVKIKPSKVGLSGANQNRRSLAQGDIGRLCP
jgi:hypothetical protein